VILRHLIRRRAAIRYLVLFQGRAGSTHLKAHLRSHPQIHAEGEILDELPRDWSMQVSRMRALYQSRYAYPTRCVGFKTKLSTVADVQQLAAFVTTQNVRIIHLHRDNPVKLAVSIVRAARLRELYGVWNRHLEGIHLGAFAISRDEFAAAIRRVGQYKRLADFVNTLTVPRLDISYENLLASERATIANVLDFLSVRDWPTRSRTYKNTPDRLADAVTNLRELREAFPEYDTYFG
jgi:LPS sulfotransferase NodH